MLSGYKEKDLTFGTWDVKHCSELQHTSLLSQLNQYRLNIITGNEVAGDGHNGHEITHILLHWLKKKGGDREFGVAFVVERSMKKKGT